MKNLTIGAALLAALALGVYALTNSPATAGPITIGVIAPLSGQYAFLGESERNAMQLAAEDLLGEGQEVRLIFEDDKYEAKTGLTAYQKLKSVDNVDAVVTVSAPVIEVLRPVVAKDQMLMLTLGESLFHESDTVFQLMPASDLIAPKLGEEAAKRYKKIAVVYGAGGSLWQKWHDDFVKGVGDKAETITVALAPDSDFRTEVAKLVAAKPDAATVFLPLEDGVKYLKELQRLDASGSVQVICDGNLEFSIQQYIDEVGAEIFDDCISTTLPNTMTGDFVSRFKAKFNADPFLTADYAYDAVAIIADLASIDKSEWVAELNDDYSIAGASADVSFNAAGTRSAQVVLHQFVDGKFVDAK